MFYQLKKHNSVFILAILLNVNPLFAQQGWYNLNVSFGGGGIFFKDVNYGIIGDYKTTNAGLTWIYMGSLTGGGSVTFPTQNTGYGVISNYITKTTNFGDNWIMQNNPSVQPLNSINFPNVNTGFACGDGGTLIKTTNGGNNWFIIEPISPPLALSYYFKSFFFTDSATGYIVGYRNADTSVFIKTTNGGNNWTAQRYTISNWGRFTSLFFINANTGFIGSASNAYILKTTNGGAGWNQIMIPTTNPIYSLYFPSASIGYGCCYGGQILKTMNGGNNWFLQTTGTGSILYSIFFINNLTGYVSGDNNTVLNTTDGGGPPIGIKPISNEVPGNYMLYQNFPNPFNSTTKIRFNIPKSSFTILRIIDIRGVEILTLVNEKLQPGDYEAEWSPLNYPSGVYFYRLITDDFTQTKRMILLK